MRAISLTQPWASLVMLGFKRIETRAWKTTYAGELAIHATRELDRDALREDAIWAALKRAGVILTVDDHEAGLTLPVSAILGTVRHCGCHPTEWLTPGSRVSSQLAHTHRQWEMTDDERAFGNYAPGRYGWLWDHPRPLGSPVPCRGYQGLWPVPEDIARQVREQLA